VISMHQPVLQIVLPLMAAPICIILRSATVAWGLALVVTWGALAASIALLLHVIDHGTISYAIGNWPPPWGIEYRIDLLSAFVLLTVSIVGAFSMVFARRSVAKEVAADRVYLFYAMYILCFTGLMGMAITGDAFNLFVFLEISSLSSYVLISLGRDRRALMAAFRYLIMGTLGATFYIIGVGLMYMMTGTLNIADLATRVPELIDSRTIQVALAFLTVGLSLKLALFPLHLWLPNAYAYAPTVVTVFLAATATKVAVYAMIRIVYTVFGGPAIFAAMPIGHLLVALGVLSMVAGALTAIWQTNVKRLLAYSSVSQIGYMVLGIGLASTAGLAGAVVHIFNHAMIKAILFMAIGCVVYRIGSAEMHDIRGFAKRMPITAACVVVGGLSLVGAPLTLGFITKWLLLQGALAKGWWWIAALIVVSSLLALVYVWRIISTAYLHPPTERVAHVREAPAAMLCALVLLTAASVVVAVDGSLIGDLALATAAQLFGGG
jgi:Formate hydrogenlyase subunit 3/Multisubunit Na+/H+ antiporter, MnhD subunit